VKTVPVMVIVAVGWSSRHASGRPGDPVIPHGARLVALLGVFASPALQAHDFWIEPARFLFDGPGTVAVTLRVGQDYQGDSVPFIDDWIDRFEIHDGQGVRRVESQIGDDPAAVVEARTPGSTWIAYQSRDDFIELPPDKFRDYLRMEGMEFILPQREQRGLAEKPAREYYVRCVKSLLWWPGGRGGDVVSVPLGLTLEIVPLQNPYTLSSGEPLTVRVLHLGRPGMGLLLKAFTREQPEQKQQLRTDAEGRVRLELDRGGTWLVKTVHMVAVDGDTYCDWRSYWASLTFAIDR